MGGSRVGQLNPQRVEGYALGVDEPVTASGRIAWRLARGEPVTAAGARELGGSVATLTATVSALRRRGWVVETSRQRGEGQGSSVYRVVGRPDVAQAGIVPTAPLRFGRSADDQLQEREPAPAPNGKRRGRPPRPSDLEDLALPAPVAPGVGTVLRVTMLAEDNGAAVMALRDRAGAVWFVRVEGAQ